MKKTLSTALVFVLAVIMTFSLAACGDKNADALWENAMYTQDTELGTGATSVQVEVKAGDKSVTFTVKTDKTILGEALVDNGLIEGEIDDFGMYVKQVNGITADYDVDQSYWSFYKNGEYMMTGVDATEVTDGEHYELVYTK